MTELKQKKVLTLEELITVVNDLKISGKSIVQSHGTYDLIHPGILSHLQGAKSQGDILIVTVVRDRDVRKGFGRPIFPEQLRAENVAAITIVGYVCIVDDLTPFECVGLIQPDVFAKGKAYKEKDRIHHEEQEFYLQKCRVYETGGEIFNSSAIIHKLLDIYPEKVKTFIREFRKDYSIEDIIESVNSIADSKILLVGDGIIDEYCYSDTMGKSPKSQLIVNRFVDQEIFAGGVFAIANHLACLCGEVHLVSLLGEDDSREDFVRQNLLLNVYAKFFTRPDGPTVIKRRYINKYSNQKMFEINYLNDNYVDMSLEEEIISYVRSVIADYDLVLVSDFGHGFITPKMQAVIEQHAKKLAVNTQTNGANAGYNLITKYHKTGFICLDVAEARLATQMRHEEIQTVGEELMRQIDTEHLIITLGAQGSICFSKKGQVLRTPALSTKVIDIIGAGDAFFSYTAPCFAKGMSPEFVSFIGNIIGALAVQIVGNKKPVEKRELFEFIDALYKIQE